MASTVRAFFLTASVAFFVGGGMMVLAEKIDWKDFFIVGPDSRSLHQQTKPSVNLTLDQSDLRRIVQQ